MEINTTERIKWFKTETQLFLWLEMRGWWVLPNKEREGGEVEVGNCAIQHASIFFSSSESVGCKLMEGALWSSQVEL